MPDIDFSKEEFQLLKNHQFFDYKARITTKVLALFSGIENNIRNEITSTKHPFPDLINSAPSKISKGENYLNCPYIVLDYPRIYSRENIFALRTIFWWGHYFSNAFIIAGHSYHRYLPRFLDMSGDLKNKNWYLCIFRTPWKLEKASWNYVKLSKLSEKEIRNYLKKYSFIKIARIYSLDQYKKLDGETLHFLTDLKKFMA